MPAPCWVCVPGVIAIVMPAIRCPATVHHPDSGAMIVPTSSTALPPGASNGVRLPLDSRRSWRIVPPLTTRSTRCCPSVTVTVLGVMRISVSDTVTVPAGPGAASRIATPSSTPATTGTRDLDPVRLALTRHSQRRRRTLPSVTKVPRPG